VAATYYHFENDSANKLDAGSVDIPKSGAKIEVDPTNGVIVVFPVGHWSIKNVGYYDVAGTPTENADGDLYYRWGTIATPPTTPTCTLAVDTAAKRQSLLIERGADELVSPIPDYGMQAMFLKCRSGSVAVLIRPNDRYDNRR
jgi:hypothetical protein